MTYRTAKLALILTCALAATNARGQGLTYQFTPFRPVQPPGTLFAEPQKINASGSIVCADFSGVSIIYDPNGVGTVVSVPGAGLTILQGINSRGATVGLVYSADFSSQQGLLRDTHGNFSLVAAPGATSTRLYGNSDNGGVVGSADSSGLIIDQNGNLSTYSAPGAMTTVLFGVNNGGTIVGTAYNDQGSQGFTLSSGTQRGLNIPGATASEALDITNQGKIVGDYTDAQGATHGFLLDDNTLTTFDIPFDTPDTITIDLGPPIGVVTWVRSSVPTMTYILGINEPGTLIAQTVNLYESTNPDFPVELSYLDWDTGQRVPAGPQSAIGGSKLAGPLNAKVQSMTDVVMSHGPLRGQKRKAARLDNGATVLFKQ